MRLASQSFHLVLALTLSVFVGVTVHAQVGAGQLTGLVTDAGGAAVPGAAITAVAVETGATRTVVSSAAGVFTMPSLQPGAYRIEVESRGFRSVRQDGVRVETGV